MSLVEPRLVWKRLAPAWGLALLAAAISWAVLVIFSWPRADTFMREVLADSADLGVYLSWSFHWLGALFLTPVALVVCSLNSAVLSTRLPRLARSTLALLLAAIAVPVLMVSLGGMDSPLDYLWGYSALMALLFWFPSVSQVLYLWRDDRPTFGLAAGVGLLTLVVAILLVGGAILVRGPDAWTY